MTEEQETANAIPAHIRLLALLCPAADVADTSSYTLQETREMAQAAAYGLAPHDSDTDVAVGPRARFFEIARSLVEACNGRDMAELREQLREAQAVAAAIPVIRDKVGAMVASAKADGEIIRAKVALAARRRIEERLEPHNVAHDPHRIDHRTDGKWTRCPCNPHIMERGEIVTFPDGSQAGAVVMIHERYVPASEVASE